jgi:hypothetical protein
VVKCYTQQLGVLAQLPAKFDKFPIAVTSALAGLLGAITGFKQVLTQQLSYSAAWAAILDAREDGSIVHTIAPKLVKLGRLNMLHRPAFYLEQFCSTIRSHHAADYSCYTGSEDDFTQIFSCVRQSSTTSQGSAAPAAADAAAAAATGIRPSNSSSSLESGEIPQGDSFRQDYLRMYNARLNEHSSKQH